MSKHNVRRSFNTSSIENLVVPSGRCNLSHRKLKYLSKEKASRALESTQKAANKDRRQEARIYHCGTSKGGCGGWHLTSMKEKPDFAKQD